MEVCLVCRNDKQWHRDNNPVHPFSTEEGAAAGLNKKPKEVVAKRITPSDPVLRIALVKAGIVTYSQILAAEEEFNSGRAVVLDSDSASRGSLPLDEIINEPGIRSGHGESP